MNVDAIRGKLTAMLAELDKLEPTLFTGSEAKSEKEKAYNSIHFYSFQRKDNRLFRVCIKPNGKSDKVPLVGLCHFKTIKGATSFMKKMDAYIEGIKKKA